MRRSTDSRAPLPPRKRKEIPTERTPRVAAAVRCNQCDPSFGFLLFFGAGFMPAEVIGSGSVFAFLRADGAYEYEQPQTWVFKNPTLAAVAAMGTFGVTAVAAPALVSVPFLSVTGFYAGGINGGRFHKRMKLFTRNPHYSAQPDSMII